MLQQEAKVDIMLFLYEVDYFAFVRGRASTTRYWGKLFAASYHSPLPQREKRDHVRRRMAKLFAARPSDVVINAAVSRRAAVQEFLFEQD